MSEESINKFIPEKLEPTTIRLARKLKMRADKYKAETGVGMAAQISDALNKFLTERGY